MDEQLNRQIKFDPVPKLQFVYQRIQAQAEVQEEIDDGNGGKKKMMFNKKILKECSGKFQPNTVTAILGPSGSGKTTMLNLLSGRLLAKNMKLRGRIIINGKIVQSMNDYKTVIGYVMQEDLMLPTFTPRETFRFITDMRLPFKTEQEKDAIVQSMIESLGLTKCSETYVGNSLIRGLSGGEKKRTSVGVELLINPSLIFLDEPTTGLDSTTALNLVRFLNRLANAGRTVVTTIHQPSSEIFLEFDKILLMLDGHVVYNNDAKSSMDYFRRLGLPVPTHSNPMQHYMKLMNKQGISLKMLQQNKQINNNQVDKLFNQRIQLLVKSYKKEQKPHNPTISDSLQFHNNMMASWCTQFLLIFKRSCLNQFRNPLGLKAKIFQIIFFAIITVILYQRQAKTLDNYIQNVRGVLFFITMNLCFAGVFGTLNVFSQQRPIFIRQRLSDTYSTTSYFFGRSFAYLPLQIILPLLLISISYFAVHLQKSGDAFMILLAASWLASWFSSGYGLLLSTAFSDPQVAIALVPLLIVPLMLVGGFFAPLTNVPDFYKLFEYISVFKYMYQTAVYSQFYKYSDGFQVTLSGKTYQYKGDILGKNGLLYFEEPFWLSMLLMGLIGLALRILSLIALYLISNPSKIKLQPPSQDEKVVPVKRIDYDLVLLDLTGDLGQQASNANIKIKN